MPSIIIARFGFFSDGEKCICGRVVVITKDQSHLQVMITITEKWQIANYIKLQVKVATLNKVVMNVNVLSQHALARCLEQHMVN